MDADRRAVGREQDRVRGSAERGRAPRRRGRRRRRRSLHRGEQDGGGDETQLQEQQEQPPRGAKHLLFLMTERKRESRKDGVSRSFRSPSLPPRGGWVEMGEKEGQ